MAVVTVGVMMQLVAWFNGVLFEPWALLYLAVGLFIAIGSLVRENYVAAQQRGRDIRK
jgi:hypothetical protein